MNRSKMFKQESLKMLILDAKMTNLPHFKHNLNFPLKNPLVTSTHILTPTTMESFRKTLSPIFDIVRIFLIIPYFQHTINFP